MASAQQLMHSVLVRWGTGTANLDAAAQQNFVNVGNLGFSLGVGLDAWVAGMLPMARDERHIEFLDTIMDGVS